MRVLITNLSLCARSGTETYARDLALGLRDAGHVPLVYSPLLGDVADELRAEGVAVSDDLGALGAADAIHGHHHPETMTALIYHRHVPGLFVCHDRRAWHDHAPRLPRLRRYVAVDENCRERLSEEGIGSAIVVPNAVDGRRFLPRGPLPSRPARALLFSNYACDETHAGPVRDACAALGLSLDVVGAASGRPCARPEAMLGAYDVVFAKARCALEAMATGCAVVLCDHLGAGPMVRASEWHRLRAWNFGRRVCDGPLTAEALADQVRRYDPADAAATCRLTRAEADVPALVAAFLRLYAEAIEEQHAAPLDPDTEARALADYLRTQRPYPLLYRVAEMDRECDALRHAADVARAGWHAARAGWHATHEQAERMRAAYEAEFASRPTHDEGERLRRELAELREGRERSLTRRLARGGEISLNWLRNRARRAG